MCVKFQKDLPKTVRGVALPRKQGRNGYLKCSNNNSSKVGKPELRFLSSAHPLIVLYTFVKFHENISIGFQVTEQTQTHNRQMERQTDRLGRKYVSWTLLGWGKGGGGGGEDIIK